MQFDTVESGLDSQGSKSAVFPHHSGNLVFRQFPRLVKGL